MTVEALRNALEARPFTAFTLEHASGDSVPVPSPAFVLINPKAPRTIAVAHDEGFRVIDLLLVEELKFRGPRTRRAG
jgi:hypothetical protein